MKGEESGGGSDCSRHSCERAAIFDQIILGCRFLSPHRDGPGTIEYWIGQAIEDRVL
jgi:hypothetical protein